MVKRRPKMSVTVYDDIGWDCVSWDHAELLHVCVYSGPKRWWIPIALKYQPSASANKLFPVPFNQLVLFLVDIRSHFA